MRIVFVLVTLALLIAAAVTDLERRKIPNEVTLGVIAAGLVVVPFFVPWSSFLPRLLLMVLIYAVYDRFMRGGDAKLLMAICILNGALAAIVGFAVACMAMTAYAFYKDREGTRIMLGELWASLRSLNLAGYKPAGPKYPLSPFLLAGYLAVLAMVMIA